MIFFKWGGGFEVGKNVSEPPPPPLPLSDFFKAGAASSKAICPPPPLIKHPGAAPAERIWSGI